VEDPPDCSSKLAAETCLAARPITAVTPAADVPAPTPPIPPRLETGAMAGPAVGTAGAGATDAGAEIGTRAAAANARGTFTCLTLAAGAGAGAISGVACSAAEASTALPAQTHFGREPAVIANMGSEVTIIAQATIALVSCLRMLLVRNTREGEERNSSLATASSPLKMKCGAR